MNAAADAVTIRLDAAGATNAFGLDVEVGGAMATHTILAEGPGVFRILDLPGLMSTLARKGWIVGFLQRGPLRLPVVMPCDGWVLATAADGVRAEHGTPLIRILRKLEEIAP